MDMREVEKLDCLGFSRLRSKDKGIFQDYRGFKTW